MRFAEQVAIVTGGAQGIGGATARRLASEGATVLIVDLDQAAATQNVATIRASGGLAACLIGDVADPVVIESAVDQAVAQFGKLTILVCNAYNGGPGLDGNAVEATATAWDQGMALLVRALFLGAKYAVPQMIAAGGGAIVNIASVHGLLAARRRVVYDTGKAAVIGLTRQLAVDYGPAGIRVNAICPGLIITERGQAAFEADPGRRAYFSEQYPVRRVGQPADIAGVVAFLCSSDAAFMTGQALVVDGGMTIQLQEDLGVQQAQYAQAHPEFKV